MLAYFGRFDEACGLLRKELQHNPSIELSLRVAYGLIKVCHQANRWEEVAEVAETALNSTVGCSRSFEQLRILYFLADSLYLQNQRERIGTCHLLD